MSSINYVAIDIETTGLNSHKEDVLCTGIYSPKKFVCGKGKNVPPNLLDYQQIYHNGLFDCQWGIEGLRLDHDTAILSSLLPVESHSLEDLAVDFLGVKRWKKMVNRKKLDDSDDTKAYNKIDCEQTYNLFPVLWKAVEKRGMLDYYLNYSMPLARELLHMIEGGVRIDVDKLHELATEYNTKAQEQVDTLKSSYPKYIKRIEQKLLREARAKVKGMSYKDLRTANPAKYKATFNINSVQQMLKLFHLDGLYPKVIDPKTKKMKNSTSNEALSAIDSPIATIILEYRSLIKIAQFFAKWDEVRIEDMIYPSYSTYKVRTGRASSSEPNIQQVPVRRDGRVREIFIPAEGKLFSIADYSQIELRLAAHFSCDEHLIALISSGVDFHGWVAKDIMGLDCEPNEVKKKYPAARDISKTLVYLTLYGGGVARFQGNLQAQDIHMEEAKCREILKKFYATFPQLRQYGFTLGAVAERQLYVTSLFGRKLWLDEENARFFALNTKLQGSAGELTLFSLIGMGPAIREIGGRLVATIHDEVIVEHTPDITDNVNDIIQHHMIEKVQGLRVPLEAEVNVGTTWGAK